MRNNGTGVTTWTLLDSTSITANSLSLPSDMAGFTEAELEGRLSDVTALFTNNVTGDVTVSGGTSSLGVNTVDSTHVVANGLSLPSDIATATSAELAGVISDETGTGLAVFNIAPDFTDKITADSLTADGVVRAESLYVAGITTLTGTTTLGVIAGTIDGGSATSLEIPNDDNPTTDANGEIASDNNSNALEVYIPSESESGLIWHYQTMSIPIALPDSVQAYIPDFKIWQCKQPFGIEIDSVWIQLDADAAYSMVVEEWSGADPPVIQNTITTVTTGATDTYAIEIPDTDGNIDFNDWIVLDIPTTDVPAVTVGIMYHVTEGN
jgi:hypothetical protein